MTKPDGRPATGALQRRLGVGDAVVIDLGSMIGAGIFAAPTVVNHLGVQKSAFLTWLTVAVVVMVPAAVVTVSLTSPSSEAARHHPKLTATHERTAPPTGPSVVTGR
ncbi:hypothetical protein [Streptomyces sp. PvR034]|uniref:hypothetical protein n=1 Tax=Streptomyces sp. PvR034 TaxID=3156401 RepID=UPI0033963D01